MANKRNSRNRGNKGGKPNTSPVRTNSDVDDDDESSDFKGGNRKKGSRSRNSRGSNDPAWYATNPQLLKDAASIPWTLPVGKPIETGIVRTDDNGDPKEEIQVKVPGVMALRTIPSFGMCREESDPINIASTAMYSFIRHANSGHSNYDAPDLMVYVLAMTQVYSYITFLQRVYSVSTLYAQGNRFMPKALVECMDVDYSDVTSQLANFRYGINLLIDKASSFAVPNNMSIFLRSAFLYQYIYAGGPSIKDQLYFYTPAGFLKYDLNKDPLSSVTQADSSGLEFVPFPTSSTTKMTVSGLLEYGRDMIDRLLEQEDLGIMSGDILKAYGSSGIIKLAPLPEAVEFTPVYNGLVLEQIKNATIVNAQYYKNNAICQDPKKKFLKSNLCLYREKLTDDASAAFARDIECHRGHKLITTALPNPDATTVMEITRMTPVLGNLFQSKYVEMSNGKSTEYNMDYYFLYSGSEIAIEARMILDAKGNKVTFTSNELVTKSGTNVAMTGVQLDGLLKVVSALSNFKFHPCVRYWQTTDGAAGHGRSLLGQFYDLDNYAVVHAEDLNRIHETAIMSMLSVPNVARVSTIASR